MTTTHLAPYAHCMACDWTPDPNARASVDRQAEKHNAPGHPTVSGGRPEVRRKRGASVASVRTESEEAE